VLSHVWDCSKATMNQRSLTDKLSNNEFALLEDCLVFGRGIFPRNEKKGINLTGAYDQYNIIVGMKDFTSQDGKKWLIVATSELGGQSGYPRKTTLTAIDIEERYIVIPDLTINSTIRCRESLLGFGLPVCINTYHGNAYVTNGVDRTATFNGEKWTCESGARNFEFGDFPFSLFVEFAGRMVVANTPCYPNEIAWTDALVSIPVSNNSSFFVGNMMLGTNEVVRGLLANDAMLFVFSNRGIYTIDSGFTSLEPLVNDFELFGNNCIQTFERGYALLGRFKGIPGVYLWDGSSNDPVIISKSTQKVFNDGLWETYPKTIVYQWDTEQDWSGVEGGIGWNTDEWKNSNGIMELQKISPDTSFYIYSHHILGEDGKVKADDYSGIYLSGNTERWGLLSIEAIQQGTTSIEIQVRFTDSLTPGNWTDWMSPKGHRPEPVGLTGTWRDTYKLTPSVLGVNGWTWETWRWMQWRIAGRKDLYPEVASVNRVCIKTFDKTGFDDYTTPSLASYEEKLYANFDVLPEVGAFDGRTVVLGGDSVVVQKLGRVTHMANYGRVLMIGRKIDEPSTQCQFMWSLRDNEYNGIWGDDENQVIETGWVDFADGSNPGAALAKKVLRRISLVASNPTRDAKDVTVKWCNESKGEHNWESQQEQVISIPPWSGGDGPESGGISIELPSAPTVYKNAGHRFKFQLSYSGKGGFILHALSVEADLWSEARENVWNTGSDVSD